MPWEALGLDGFVPKLLAVFATLITIGSGIIGIVWRLKTWNKRRLKLLQEFLRDREADVSARRHHLLRKVVDAEYIVPLPEEPNVAREVEAAIALLEREDLRGAQRRLEDIQERINEKRDFIQRYRDDLERHHANISLFLAAIADRRNNVDDGLKHISKAKSVLGADLEVLRYEGLLQLKAKNWDGARNTFTRLEALATGLDTRHYKAMGADGRGDALIGLGQREDAIDAYGVALTRIGQAEPQHKDPMFRGLVHLKIAQAQEAIGYPALEQARANADAALLAFRSAGRASARNWIAVTEALVTRIQEALRQQPQSPTSNRPTH